MERRFPLVFVAAIALQGQIDPSRSSSSSASEIRKSYDLFAQPWEPCEALAPAGAG